MPASFSNFVFVDFENVPSIDLSLIEGKPVHVTLLIGEKQKRLDITLVQQIRRHAAQVELIEVGASGRNALDLILAAHLGRALCQHSAADFTIISRDRDFDPLVKHLRAGQNRVTREPDFSALSIFGATQTLAPAPRTRTSAPKPATSVRAPHPSTAAAPGRKNREDKIDGIVVRLRAKTNRPKTRESLLHHINTVFGHKLSGPEQEAVLNDLRSRGIFEIPDGKKLVYSN